MEESLLTFVEVITTILSCTWYLFESVCVYVWLYVRRTVCIFQARFSTDTDFMSSWSCWNGNTVDISFLFFSFFLSYFILRFFFSIIFCWLCAFFYAINIVIIIIVLHWNCFMEISQVYIRNELKCVWVQRRKKLNQPIWMVYINRTDCCIT